ncbi:MAG: hypothetical protein WC450_11325 [Candidatus Omnitrophota bacterium]|jgi:hypothetical protein
MLKRRLTDTEIVQLSLVVAGKCSPGDDVEKTALQVFETYEKATEIYKNLNNKIPSVYEERGMRTL